MADDAKLRTTNLGAFFGTSSHPEEALHVFYSPTCTYCRAARRRRLLAFWNRHLWRTECGASRSEVEAVANLAVRSS